MEQELIFKAYLRSLARQYKAIQAAIEAHDYQRAEALLNELIEDTRKGIED